MPETYKEFVEKYGKRPADIVFIVSRKDALEEVGKFIKANGIVNKDVDNLCNGVMPK